MFKNHWRFLLFSKGNAIGLLLMIALLSSCRKGDYEIPQGVEVITDKGGGTGTVTWKNSKSYLLSGLIFVNDGQVLTIEPGTVIRAQTGQGSAASALIVARGGKIYAEGTAENPIIFTVEGDDLQGSVPLETKGLWGGLIILGNAKLNLSSHESHIEGIPLTEPRGIYGGFDDNDNSGVLRYVSVRHGGTNIGEGNEINGLTLAGVGDGTVVDYVEVVSNADDGIEFFGGTVNCRHMVVAFCDDDAIDFDLGFRGYGQFWLAIQSPSSGDKLIEAGGGIDPVTGLPYSNPYIFNATLIGRDMSADMKVMEFFSNAAGTLANSVIIRQSEGVFIEYVQDSDDSYRQFERGNLRIANNIFNQVNDNTPAGIFHVYASAGVDVTFQNETFRNSFISAGNRIADPGIEVTANYCKPVPGGDVYGSLEPVPDVWFEETNFKGAFYLFNWASGWTLISQAGFLKD
ncbi:MAG: hypothetical protein KKA81_12070 [Bacteroidetes bacterium]|nr:hypothetical protein [Bacteroidota bacterium]